MGSEGEKAEAKVCAHCERRAASYGLLCAACHGKKGIRVLYLRRRGWTPEWDRHLQRLTARAQARRPLFECEGPAAGA